MIISVFLTRRDNWIKASTPIINGNIPITVHAGGFPAQKWQKEGLYEGGEIKEMVKKVSLTGIILDILPKICLIAKDLKLGSGSCGKSGQLVPVADGSPHILIESAKVGGAA